MSTEGLPVNNVVGTNVELGPRSTADAANAASSSQAADSAAASADRAWKFSNDAAASAAAAKVSENNSAAAMANALSKVVTADQSVASTVIFKSNVYSYGEVMIQAAAGKPNTLLRFRDESGSDKGGIYAQTDTGQLNFRWNGSAYTVQLKPDGSVTFPSTVYSGTAALLKNGEYGLGSDFRPSLTGYTLASDYRINGAFYANVSAMTDTFDAANNHILNVFGYSNRTYGFQVAFPFGTDKMAFRRIQNNGVGAWKEVWHNGNTTVDANGFLKKASPIVRLFGDGTSELNDQSQGVTTERISEGVYRVSGVMGFNSDPAWGGPSGGIGLPKDNNDLTLLWVDYEVDETGDLLIKTFHRINSTAPKFAQNIVAGYKEGQPIDIPAGRWIDLRVEMPADNEPEVVLEPEQGDTPEVETKG
ncbi:MULTISPECIES: hypothetical protein [unclassified Serratia (in: enterobacteria)]|uniref:phage tail fiber protein n=1 Tax=unclassified Serratia (in: enterobacteria) TaxID=2647522 RepID=UPI00068ADA2B|nr:MULTISPECIES: hypothetical protein [unclassified Serratia (in: enterobacteria)]